MLARPPSRRRTLSRCDKRIWMTAVWNPPATAANLSTVLVIRALYRCPGAPACEATPSKTVGDIIDIVMDGTKRRTGAGKVVSLLLAIAWFSIVLIWIENMKHIMILVLMGNKLHFAPTTANPSQIIDLGTGTGTWTVESECFATKAPNPLLTGFSQVAEKYPSGIVTGIDPSAIQPEWVPPNARFLIDDAESPWVDPPDFFDLVHARHTVQAFMSYRAVIMQTF
jgi:Methyltransferase domain